MASLGHLAVGLAAARLYHDSVAPRSSLLAGMVCLSALALLPDADVISFAMGIPYRAPFGHRGASHSLVAALVCGIIVFFCCWAWSRNRHKALLAGVLGGAVVTSHGLLDTLTDGGLGVALLWPFSHQRFFAPWRPIPVAPIGVHLLSAYGATVMLTELLFFFPLFVYALWPRRSHAEQE